MTCPECGHDNTGRFRCIHWFAAEIDSPVQWIRRNMSQVPHHRRGRVLRFTQANADEFEAATKVEREPDIALSDRSRKAASR